jgi:GPI mannosyltransferase 3
MNKLNYWVTKGSRPPTKDDMIQRDSSGVRSIDDRGRSSHNLHLQIAALVTILIVGFGLRVGCAFYFKNMNYPDEIYQYLEPAHRAVFGYGLIAPEFALGLRSWLVPGLAAGIMKLASLWSDHAAVYLGVIDTVMAALSLTVVVVGFLWGQRLFGLVGAVITGSLVATWIELVYFAPKPLTDVLATDALVVAVFLVYPEGDRRARRDFFWCGLFLGIAFAIRWQLGPAYLLVALYVCRGFIRARWLPLVAGGTAPVLAGGLLDAVTWDYPFQSILGSVPLYSAPPHPDPWYYYLGVLTLNESGALIPLLLFAFLGARRLPFLAILVVAIIVFYSSVGMKIYRYIYPMLPFLLILVGIGTSEAVLWVRRSFCKRSLLLTTIAVAGWALTSAVLAVGDHFWIYLNKDGAVVDAFDKLGKRDDLCALGIVGLEWWLLPGYTRLHRNVPMYSVDPDQIQEEAKGFNYLIGPPNLVGARSAFVRQSCAANVRYQGQPTEQICVFRRPGACVQSPEHTVQSTIPRSM